jgi:predicted phosphodiesterase
MKLCILSDTQYGSKNDYLPFLENNRLFFENVFFPTLDERRVHHVVHLGDLLERRKYINYNTAHYLCRDFLSKFENVMDWHGLELHWILGNHDIYFRETFQVNASQLFGYSAMVHDKPGEVEFDDGTTILFIPWIVKENYEKIMRMIELSEAKMCFGHFELMGFETSPGIVAKEGMDPKILDKFEVVMSGHYHHRSAKGNIYYVGSHAEFTWSDYGDDHGFHIFDTETREIEFIKNPYTVFKKVWYDDRNSVPFPEREEIFNKIVKVIVSAKHDQSMYESFMAHIESCRPLEILPVEDHLNAQLSDDSEIVSEAKDTLAIMREYVDQANDTVNKTKLDTLMTDLYKEAQAEVE